MTTVTFQENINIQWDTKNISISEFLDALEENGYFPLLREIPDSEITTEVQSLYLASKSSKHRINI